MSGIAGLTFYKMATHIAIAPHGSKARYIHIRFSNNRKTVMRV